MTDAMKKCRRVQSQRFWVSQGFLSGQKCASKAAATSTQLWSGGGLVLQSEEYVLLLPRGKGRLFWEARGQQLPSQHNCPTVCQHLDNQVWCFRSDWPGLMSCTLITATQAFPEHFSRVLILEIRLCSKAITHNTSTTICSVGQGRSWHQERGWHQLKGGTTAASAEWTQACPSQLASSNSSPEKQQLVCRPFWFYNYIAFFFSL